MGGSSGWPAGAGQHIWPLPRGPTRGPTHPGRHRSGRFKTRTRPRTILSAHDTDSDQDSRSGVAPYALTASLPQGLNAS